MNIIQLIKGDVEAAKEALQKKAKEVRRLINSGEDVGFISFTNSEKQIFYPIFDGLGIPYKEAGSNGTLVGVDQDLVDDKYESI